MLRWSKITSVLLVTVMALSINLAPASAEDRICVRSTVKATIWCAVHKWSVEGGPRKAVLIARRESGLNPKAYNPTGCSGYGCKGVFQQSMRYWDGRWRSWGKDTRNNAFNMRANVIVSIRMAHIEGWGPWGG